MFPLQSERLVLEDPSFFEQDKILEDLLANCEALEGNKLTDKGVKKRQRKASSAAGIHENKDEGSNEFQKSVHRDVERQRRQEMAGLYASLRSLLPLEYIKGKRSITDHLHQAVSYIKHMQTKIEEMQMRRDKLKKLSNLPGAAVYAEDPNPNISDSSNCVKVNLCRDGMEILISSSINEESFPLSKVLADLLGRGLNVVSCISTRVDEWSLHKIQIEVNDPTSINLFKLQDRLVNNQSSRENSMDGLELILNL
ncbi:hypothetical protein Pfo_014897 [Paulownia fortunei]|nr:hypothetical protein Pfo_014897 [Paulownia fortunei]